MIDDVVTLALEVSDDPALEVEASMITSDVDSHTRIFSKK